jgi:D-glycero-D-manno-heptose 1,7-bisphosphate phosphatase
MSSIDVCGNCDTGGLLRLPAAFLDRDGVINVDYGYVGTVDRFEFISGAPEAIRLLNEAGYLVFVVTNQGGIGRGYYSEDDHLALMRHIDSELAIRGAKLDDHRFCPYHPEATDPDYKIDHCWRKPRPGMILDLVNHWCVDMEHSFLVGDKQTDLDAAAAAGVTGYLFDGGDVSVFIKKIISMMSG